MYTNTYLVEHNTAMQLADRRREAAHSRLLATIRHEQRRNETGAGHSRAWSVRGLARLVLRRAAPQSMAQA